MEPIAFLRSHPPFDVLDSAAVRRIEENLEIEFAPAGALVLRRGGARSEYLYVVRKGTVRLERDGQVVQVLEEGECFGFPSLIGATAPHVDAIASEESLLYRIPGPVFSWLMQAPAFAEYFLVDLSERLRRSASVQPLPVGAELGTPVSTLPTRPPLRIAPERTVGEAARRMRDSGTSSLIVDGEPPGILTDRDLRSRVLAEGRGPETRVAEVATRPMKTLEARATLLDALLFMLEHRVHHAPLVDGDTITGVITDTDLLRLQVKSPLHVFRHVDRLEVPADLPRFAVELKAMVETLSWGGLGAAQIGPVVSRVHDALASRLLRAAEAEAGPPPGPYAWIVFGSEGRMEQTLATDQDNALVFAGADGGGEAYFGALAERVVGWLEAASFPRCHGGFMATRWRKPLASWVATFRGWIETPEPRALLEALNFFDFRPVHGTLDLAPLHQLVLDAGREKVFLAHFARASLGLRPPLGAFRHIREDDGGVDLKKGGIVPIVSLARLYALEAGSASRPTLDRLEDAARAGTLSGEGAATLAEAFRFLLGLRLREQLRALRDGRRPSHRIPLESLSSLERSQLKDVFVAIRQIQEAAALRHSVERLA
ncbi:MAG TPA: putative nucleotidyltransferase substrate binding domain-containing protein [Candidatus Polarisedimenticolaceae bacterium]